MEDELRRGMYAFIRGARRPVTRDEAAASVGISRKLAAFHLDKLVEAGVLSARYQAAGVRKVGRAPKVYEPSGLDIRVSIPPRQHDILAEILLGGVLAERATDLVCGLNHAFLGGLVAGLEADAVQAVLDPRPGECCVELRSA